MAYLPCLFMWETLDDIDWASLEHNYGPATDVPPLLRKYRQGSACDESVPFELENLLYHQGGWVPSAATAALPYLVDIACDQLNPIRMDAFGTIELIAEEAVVPGLMVDSGWVETWRTAFPRIAELANSSDVAIRRAVITLAATVDAIDGPRLLVDRLAAENDASVRLAAIRAIGRSHAYVTDLAARSVVDSISELREFLSGPHELFAALIARSSAGQSVTIEDVPTIVAAVRAGGIERWDDNGEPGSGAYVIARHITEVVICPRQITAILTAIMAPDASETAVLIALEIAAKAAMTWKSIQDVVCAIAVKQIGSEIAEHRGRSLHVLGCLGSTAVAHADAVAECLDDEGTWRTVRNGDIALFALVRFGDRRALPLLIESLSRESTGVADMNWQSVDRFVGPSLPSRFDLAAFNPEWIDELLPVTRERLRCLDASNPVSQGFARMIMAWGRAAVSAAPDVAVALSATGDIALASALGSLGRSADVAFPPATSEDESHRIALAMARYRVTGDPEEAYPLVSAGIEGGGTYGVLEWIGEFGSMAVEHVPAISRHLESSYDWTRARAAVALWSITGRPDDAVPILTGVLEQSTVRDGVMPVTRFVIDALASIGAAAAPAGPVIRSLLDRDRRLAYHGGWRLYVEDEETRASAARLLAVIGG